uniref:Uncharacterized protein n=1 Tax=Anguilla anguilla TaxID=7936 RepID=A0A0E9U179_ANGAN
MSSCTSGMKYLLTTLLQMRLTRRGILLHTV